MLIWSGWGLGAAAFVVLGLFAAIGASDALQQWLPYGPAGSIGFVIGGLLAALGIQLLTNWRERPVDDGTEMRRGAGSLFFIPTRYWTWIVVALSTGLAILQFNATPSY
jgi:hypothetical protein